MVVVRFLGDFFAARLAGLAGFLVAAFFLGDFLAALRAVFFLGDAFFFLGARFGVVLVVAAFFFGDFLAALLVAVFFFVAITSGSFPEGALILAVLLPGAAR